MTNKKNVLFLILFLAQSLWGQKKFSFLDCVTVSASGSYNFNYLTIVDEKVNILHFPLDYEEEDALRTKNYFSYSFEAKYFLKLYKNVRIGLGGDYTMRRAGMEYVSTPKTVGHPIVIVKYDKTYRMFGPSFNLSYAIPKWGLRLTVFETYLFMPKKKRKVENGGEDLFYFFSWNTDSEDIYEDGYKFSVIGMDELPASLRIPVSSFVRFGAEIQYKIRKRFYLLLQYRRVGDGFFFGVQHRYAEKVNGVEKQIDLGGAFIGGGVRSQIGVGVAYHFFEKE